MAFFNIEIKLAKKTSKLQESKLRSERADRIIINEDSDIY